MRRTDVWLFRVGVAVVTFFAVSFGSRALGRRFHEQYAMQLAHRERSDAEERDDAIALADGYADTQGYKDMSYKLTVAQMNAATVKPHILDERHREIGAAAALLAAFLVGESAQLWAAKREAQRRVSARRG